MNVLDTIINNLTVHISIIDMLLINPDHIYIQDIEDDIAVTNYENPVGDGNKITVSFNHSIDCFDSAMTTVPDLSSVINEGSVRLDLLAPDLLNNYKLELVAHMDSNEFAVISIKGWFLVMRNAYLLCVFKDTMRPLTLTKKLGEFHEYFKSPIT